MLKSQSPFYGEFNSPTEKIGRAQLFAQKAHGTQEYGNEPYVKHLEDTVRTLERFGFKLPKASVHDGLIEDIVCAGWLHDVIEDTGTPAHLIEAEFGKNVCDIVSRVSDEPGADRHERKMLTYPKIRGHFGATVVKLADRIANVEACLEGKEEQFSKYVREFDQLFKSVHVPMIAEPMWNYLRLLVGRKFGEKPKPKTAAQLFLMKNAKIDISVRAAFFEENLRIEDHAVGSLIESLNAGDSDYENILTVEKEFKDALLLALIQERFFGNKTISEMKSWLTSNGIPFEFWAG